MIIQELRIGNITSSEIFRLLAVRKDSADNYIEECNMERRLGRALEKEENARPLSWGELVEPHAFQLLGIEYKLSSQETIQHPEIKYWAGSPDGNKFDEGKTVFDEKCPISLKSFCQLVQPLYDGLNGMDAINIIRKKHKDGEKYFWQLVSNAILTDSKFAELIVYCPYKSEIPTIRELAQEAGTSKYSWIYWALDNELSFLPDGGYYKNLNIIRFEIPQDDKDKLIAAVIKAKEKLIEYFKPELQPA